MPRPKKERSPSVQIRVRMSIAELIQIKRKAAEYGMTISALMRLGALSYEPKEVDK